VQNNGSSDPADVAIADLDGDGWEDLVGGNRLAGSVSVFLNRGNGTFAPRQVFPTGTQFETVRLGDLDMDGVPDAVVPKSIDGVTILYGKRATSSE
jgi:hypothetical protein